MIFVVRPRIFLCFVVVPSIPAALTLCFFLFFYLGREIEHEKKKKFFFWYRCRLQRSFCYRLIIVFVVESAFSLVSFKESLLSIVLDPMEFMCHGERVCPQC